MLIKKLGATAALVSVFLPLCASAADNRQQPGVIDRTLPSFQIPQTHRIDTETKPPLKAPPTLKQDKGGETSIALIQKITFSGASVINEAWLQAIADPYLGKNLSKNDISRLKYEVTRLFYDLGYILVKATTPPQDLSDGILDIQIYEATIGTIHFQNKDVIVKGIPKAISNSITSSEVFNEKNVESMIADINELNGVKASVILQPGKSFGTTDLNVILEKADEDNHYVQIDNYGHEATGRTVATAHAEHSNALLLGEKLDITGRISEDSLRSFSVGVEVPTGIRNLTAEIDYLYSENDIEGTLQSGTTHVIDTAMTSNIINTRNKTAKVRVGLETRNHKSEINGLSSANTQDDIRQVYITASYLHRAASTAWYSSATISKGVDFFGASNRGDLNASRTANGGGDAEAVKFEPVLVANFKPNDEGIMKVVASGQFASDILLASDLFIIGGYGSIRGFLPAQEAGESGYQFSLEYNHDIPVADNWTLKAGPFFDGGAVFNRLTGNNTDSHLYSAGIGFEGVTDIIPAGDTKIRLDWAHPLGDYASNNVDDDTFYFRLSQDF